MEETVEDRHARVLILEDHTFFSQALRLLLERRHEGRLRTATVSVAPTVAEGLRLVAEAGPFDLAIVDLMLPDGDGTEVVRAIKERWPGAPVAVLSGLEDPSRALEAGADETISKGTSLKEIAAILVRLAGDGCRTGS